MTTTTCLSDAFRGTIRRIVNSTHLFSNVLDEDDLLQAARLAVWRAAGSYDPGLGASFRSYITTAIRRAVHEEANRFHCVFTLGRRDDRSELSGVRTSQWTDPTALPDIEIEWPRMSALEMSILERRFLSNEDMATVAAEHDISVATAYRVERRLRNKIEEGVLNG